LSLIRLSTSANGRCGHRLLAVVIAVALAVTGLAVGTATPAGAAGDPLGTVTNYTGTGISYPFGITAGPDGNVWFANNDNNSIGRIGAVPGPLSFSDVPSGHPFETEIGWLASTGITAGYADGTFRPTNAVTRQAMASFLYKYEGQPGVTLTEPYFADVPDSNPFYAAIHKPWLPSCTGTTTFPSE